MTERSINENNTIWRMIDVLKEASDFLNEKGIESPRLNAEQLLAHVLNISRVDLYLQFDRPLSPEERQHYKGLLRRRAGFEPLQYILGHAEFMSLSFVVTPDVLIPRPETELLVEKVMELAQDREIRLVDIGVGSGSISVSLAHYIPAAKITAIDISENALKVARQNAEINGVSSRIDFCAADLFAEDFSNQISCPVDFIVANPPYISQKEWPGIPEEVRLFEPKHALTDNQSGLTYFHRIAEITGEWLAPGGRLLVEVGDGQSENVEQIFYKNGWTHIQSWPDLNGIMRVVEGTKSK